jgi:hypothetical protein
MFVTSNYMQQGCYKSTDIGFHLSKKAGATAVQILQNDI